MKIDEFPQRYRGAIIKQIAEQDRRARSSGKEITESRPGWDQLPVEGISNAPRRESVLQCGAEKWLDYVGYWRRTATSIAAGPPPRGWQIHIANAPRNPLVLDLLLLDNCGTWVEIELKGATTRVATHQQQLIEQDSRRFLCRSIEELRSIVLQFVAN